MRKGGESRVGAIPRTRRRGERLGVIDMMRRGGVAERVIGLAPRVRRKTVARVKRALLCHGVVVCGWASGSSVNKCTFLYIPCVV